MLTGRLHIFAMAAALGATLSAQLSVAETVRSEPRTPAQEKIAKQLDQFEYTAASMRNEMDQYVASMRSIRPHFESHVYRLAYAKEHVNDLGAKLSELELLSLQGTELQQAAIREARPHLEAVAYRVQAAIEMLNEDQRNYRSTEFRGKVNGMYEHSDRLYSKVDTITDYEKARNRAAEEAAVLAGPDEV
jgi:hypothetical protein